MTVPAGHKLAYPSRCLLAVALSARRAWRYVRRSLGRSEPPRIWAVGVYWRRRDDVMSRVHQLAYRLTARKRKARARALMRTLLWPVVAACRGGGLALGPRGGLARERGAGPPWRQIGQICWLAVRHHIMPEAYYKLELYRPENRREVNEYLQHHEIVALLPAVRVAQRAAWFDKRNLPQLCERAGLPCIPVVARVTDGRFALGDGLPRLPREDLFVKLENEWGGRGASCWRYDAAADQWRNGSGAAASERELGRRLEQQAGGRSMLVQPRVRNHPAVAQHFGRGLCTVRVVTFWDGGAVERLAASFRMPTAGGIVDNLAAGGLASWIEEDGRLRAAVAKTTDRFTRHPDTGAKIEGFCVPYWNEVCALAEKTHRAAAYPGFIGWDIAVTDCGAVLVEANGMPCVELIQMPAGRPMGAMGFGARYMRLHDQSRSRVRLTDRLLGSGPVLDRNGTAPQGRGG